MEVQKIVVEHSDDVESRSSNRFRILDVLIVLARNKQTIVRPTIAAAVAVALLTLLLPNRYTGVTKILPPQQNESLITSMMGQLGSLAPMAAMAQSGLGFKNPNDIYVGMLKSETVENAIVQRFHLMELFDVKKLSKARKELEANTNIQSTKEGFITIAVEDKDPKRAADMANAYVEELRTATQSIAVTEAGQRRIFFEQQLKQASDALASAEQALRQTQQSTGIIQIEAQSKAIIDSVFKLKAAIAAKEVEVQALGLSLTPENPKYRVAQQELQNMRSQLSSMVKQSGSGDDMQVATSKIPGANLEYVRKLRDVKYQETLFELLSKQFEAAKLDEGKSSTVIQVLDPAREPDTKSSPKRSLIVLAVTAIVFFGALAWVLASETIKHLHDDPVFSNRLEVLKSYIFSGSGNISGLRR